MEYSSVKQDNTANMAVDNIIDLSIFVGISGFLFWWLIRANNGLYGFRN